MPAISALGKLRQDFEVSLGYKRNPLTKRNSAKSCVSQTSLELTYIVEDDLDLLVFLPPPPKFQGYKYAFKNSSAKAMTCAMKKEDAHDVHVEKNEIERSTSYL